MGIFANFAAADRRCVVLMASGFALEAHSCQTDDGKIAVRLLRPMGAAITGTTADGQSKAGAWDILTDDLAT